MGPRERGGKPSPYTHWRSETAVEFPHFLFTTTPRRLWRRPSSSEEGSLYELPSRFRACPELVEGRGGAEAPGVVTSKLGPALARAEQM